MREQSKSVCREAGIHDLTPMICVTPLGRLADAGVDIVKFAELMNHQSTLTTRRIHTQLKEANARRDAPA